MCLETHKGFFHYLHSYFSFQIDRALPLVLILCPSPFSTICLSYNKTPFSLPSVLDCFLSSYVCFCRHVLPSSQHQFSFATIAFVFQQVLCPSIFVCADMYVFVYVYLRHNTRTTRSYVSCFSL